MTLVVDNLTKTYITAGGSVTALNGVSFSVETGKFVSIIGKSGSGKSTLLSILGTLDSPTGGSITVDGDEVTHLSSRRQTAYRAHKIGFVFQQYDLIPNLTARENVILALEFGGYPAKDRLQRAADLLNEVGIEDDQQLRRPNYLSGGQQQRVAIARALANHPSFILADEPTGNLDSETSETIFNLLKTLSRKEKTTIIAVTHDLDIAKKTDITFILKDGKITEKN